MGDACPGLGKDTAQIFMTPVHIREVISADVPAMAACHLNDPNSDGTDRRMAAYFEGEHHPQNALRERVGYVALANNEIVGYIAGHRTTRHGCAGEVQYLFVSREFRRRGIATALLRQLAEWFQSQGVRKVCVAIADDSPPEARPFVESVAATPLKKFWYAWPDIGMIVR